MVWKPWGEAEESEREEDDTLGVPVGLIFGVQTGSTWLSHVHRWHRGGNPWQVVYLPAPALPPRG